LIIRNAGNCNPHQYIRLQWKVKQCQILEKIIIRNFKRRIWCLYTGRFGVKESFGDKRVVDTGSSRYH